MSDIPTADVVSFQTGARSILRNGGNADLERPRASQVFFGSGGRRCVLLNIEVNELSQIKLHNSHKGPG